MLTDKLRKETELLGFRVLHILTQDFTGNRNLPCNQQWCQPTTHPEDASFMPGTWIEVREYSQEFYKTTV